MPQLTDWIAYIVGRGAKAYRLNLPSIIGYSVVGIATDPRKAAKIDLWRRERLPIPSVYFDNPELLDDLNELMRMASRVGRHLLRTAEVLTWALAERAYLDEAMDKRAYRDEAMGYLWTGKITSREVQRSLDNFRTLAKSFGLVTRFWAELGKSFYRTLFDLPQHGFLTTRESWRKELIRVASRCFGEVRAGLLHEERAFAILAPLDAAFHRRLFAILKDNAGKEEEDDEEDDSTIA